MWGRFAVAELKISKIYEIRLYLTFSFFGVKVVNERKINIFKGCGDFGFLNFVSLD